MLSTRLEARRDTAAQSTLEAIRRDIARAPQELKPLLVYIEEHLFDAEYSVRGMKEACRTRDNSIATRFRGFLGSRPSTYVRERRLAIGAEMLRSTIEEIWKIAELVGYSSPQVFLRNFKDSFGSTPGAYRTKYRAQAGTEPTGGLPIADFPPHELREALAGKIDPSRGEELIQNLERLYRPGCDEAGRPKFGTLCLAVADGPTENQSSGECVPHVSERRAFFDLLRQMSQEVGRRNRRFGLRLAEMALESVEESASTQDGERFDLSALAWAWLDNARRLALDFSGAEEAFENSHAEWQKIRSQGDEAVYAEICAVEAAFRVVEHRFEEAMELIKKALAVLLEGNNYELTTRTLILRSNISCYLGDRDASIDDLNRALEMSDGDGRLQLSIYQNLSGVCALAGWFDRAEQFLPRTKVLCSRIGEPFEHFRLEWIEGLVNKGLGRGALAEANFLASRAGFRSLGQWRFAGVVSLDLALLWQTYHRPEVAALVAEVIPILDGFGVRQEADAARALLREAITRDQVTLDTLLEARSLVNCLIQDPAISFVGRVG